MFKKIAIWATFFVLVGISLVGCTKEEKELNVYGGELVKNNVMKVNNYETVYGIPLVTTREIESFEIDEIVTSGKGDYNIEFKEKTEEEEYNDMYYCFVYFNVKLDPESESEFSVDKVIMNINDEKFEYNIDCMKFQSGKNYYGKDTNTEDTSIVYGQGKEIVLNDIPTKDDAEEVMFDIQKACTIKEIGFLDFVDYDVLSLSVNGKKTDLNGEIKLDKGDEVSITYTLNYKEGVTENDMLITTFYINYLDNKGKECAFVDEQGLEIINFINDNFIKDYIDSKFGE